MTQNLILRFDAPLLAFGGSMVDNNGVTQAFPARSMIAGLLANALGWDHRDDDKTQALQDALCFAARVDRAGESLLDYQTVDLGLPWMLPKSNGWTTRGVLAERGGGNSEGTHIRYRYYWADSVHTVAVTYASSSSALPELNTLAEALRSPARPLFIGRKPCLPSSPILLAVMEAPNPLAALATVPLSRASPETNAVPAWWDGTMHESLQVLTAPPEAVLVTDERDWRSQVHVGKRTLMHGRLKVQSNPRSAA